MLATGNEAEEHVLRMLCQRVQRLLRIALSDWYGYLSREALSTDVWKHGIPWWAKRIPDRLDLDWALNDMYRFCRVPGMMLSLYTSVDETVLSMKRDEEMLKNPPDIHTLHEALKELRDVVGV
jgi:hypothetical protein